MAAKEGASSSTPSDRDSSPSENDQTSQNTVAGNATTAPLQRRLKSRHLQMIAIGGTVGTGLVRKPLTSSRPTNLYAPCLFVSIAWNTFPFHSRLQRSIADGQSSSDLEVLLQRQDRLEPSSHTRLSVPWSIQSWLLLEKWPHICQSLELSPSMPVAS